MRFVLTCRCGEVVVKSINDTTKVRSKVLVFKGQGAYVVCKGCGCEHEIPLQLDRSELRKSKNPKLFIDNANSIRKNFSKTSL